MPDEDGWIPSANEEDALAATGDVTRLLHSWSAGDEAARDELMRRLYAELRQVADRSLRRERPDHTLQPTALVHEAYLRLRAQDRGQWRNREQFLAVAAQLMRRILVDHARRRRAAKRDLGLKIAFDDERFTTGDSPSREVELLNLDRALAKLQRLDPRQARIVELRHFGGLKVEDTAAVLGVSARTIKREWTLARAWLRRELTGGGGEDAD